MIKILRKLFSQEDKRIFRYFNGRKKVVIDPLVAWAKLKDHPTFELAVHPALIDLQDVEAIAVTVAAVREIFGAVPLNDTGTVGLTQLETLGLLFEFCGWLDSVKKNTNVPPILQPPTELQHSGQSTTNAA